MSPESLESPELDFRISGPDQSGKSGISIDTGLRTSPESRTPLRVFLTPEQDEEVKANGHRFCVLHPSSYPGAHPGRHVMDFLPVTYEQAVAILDFVEGRARIQRIKAKP